MKAMVWIFATAWLSACTASENTDQVVESLGSVPSEDAGVIDARYIADPPPAEQSVTAEATPQERATGAYHKLVDRADVILRVVVLETTEEFVTETLDGASEQVAWQFLTVTTLEALRGALPEFGRLRYMGIEGPVPAGEGIAFGVRVHDDVALLAYLPTDGTSVVVGTVATPIEELRALVSATESSMTDGER